MLALVVALVAAAAIGRSQPAEPEPAARGFDHLVHEGKVSVAGSASLACADCHLIRGRIDRSPGHAACFGACHGDRPGPLRARTPQPLDDDRRRLCTVCHAPAAVTALEQGTATALPARPTVDADYGLAFPHRVHDGLATCKDCHGDPDAPGPPPRTHARCAGCHDAAAAPAMNACEGCHRAAYGPATAPHLTGGPYPVDAAFSHRSHRRHTDRCEACHAAVTTVDDNALPAPTMDECAACHDGTRAFATVGATCTRCHQPPRISLRRRDLPTRVARFSHREHAERGLELACARCHQLGPEGRPLPPSADHAPCSDAGCHAAEFASLTPTICTGCHVGDEPWRALHYDRPPAEATEHGSRFSHRAHLTGEIPRVTTACSDCHDTRSTRRDRPVAAGHDACTGAGCHDDQARPPLHDCTGCHELGLIPDRARARATADWSVRQRFDHGDHRTDPRTETPMRCTDCHLGAADSARIETMPTPPKSTCAGCHDGETAFKVTGHGCARCHGS
jgi:c(7)-type cytochrome triheme protein